MTTPGAAADGGTPAASVRTGPAGRLLAFIADRANPMLVRCVRQELRSRTFISVYLLLLAVATLAATFAAGWADAGQDQRAGQGLFGILAWAWSFVVAVQALGTFAAVTRERNEDTWDLVDLTGMRPGQVLRGLLLANLAHGQLYTAALAPFLAMSYLLRGLDLMTIAFALVAIPLTGIAASTLAVFCACLGNNKGSRAFLGGLLGLFLIGCWFGSRVLWMEGQPAIEVAISGLRDGQADAWLATGMLANAWAAFVILMLVLSGALLTHRAGDRSGGPRLIWFLLWLDLTLWLLVVTWRNAAAGRSFLWTSLSEPLLTSGLIGVIWAAAVGLFSVSEDYELSPRQARAITAARGWRRALTPLLGPGAARGRLAFCAFTALALLLSGIGAACDSGDSGFAWMLASALIAGHASLILWTTDLLYRGPLARWLDTPLLRRGFLLVMVAVWSLGPVLAALVFDTGHVEKSWLATLSPFWGAAQVLDRHGSDINPVDVAIPALGGLAAWLVLLIQGIRLTIITRRVQARGDDANPRGG
jgi:hypothetical protein